jgi:hypothetical protein
MDSEEHTHVVKNINTSIERQREFTVETDTVLLVWRMPMVKLPQLKPWEC